MAEVIEVNDYVNEESMDEDEESMPKRLDYQETLSQGRTLLIKFDSQSSCVRKVAFAQAPISLPDRPANKTLILSQLPPWSTPQGLQALFAQVCGPVKATFFCRNFNDVLAQQDPSVWPQPDTTGAKIRGIKCGFVVFEKAARYTFYT